MQIGCLLGYIGCIETKRGDTMNMKNIFDEYEAELQAKGDAMVASGEWDIKMEAMRKKSEAEMARMIASGAIQTEPEEEDEEDEGEE